MHQIKVDIFSSKYQESIIELIVNIQQQEFGIDITAEDQPDLSDIPGFYQKGKGNFWVAIKSDKVIGTISLIDIGNNQATLRKIIQF